MNRDRGALHRIGGVILDSPTSDSEAEATARNRIKAAANGGALRLKAERNTRRMITVLARALGVQRVSVQFRAA